MELAYSFLAQQAYDENPAAKSTNLLKILSIKQLDDYMPAVISSGIGNLEKIQNKNGEFYYDLYSIEKYKYVLTNVESSRIQKTNLQKLNLNVIDDYLNIFFISEKLRNYCLILSWSKMIDINTELPLLKEAIQIVQSNFYPNIPAISIYYQIYLTNIEPDNLEHYFKLKNHLKDYLHLFPHSEARDIINAAINYTIQKHNSGNLNFYKENFELYDESIKSGLIFINNEISPWAFKNIVTLALRLGHFQWTQNFIIELSPKINKDFRDNAVNYNLASLYFYQKNYDQAIPLLQKVQFDELNYGLGAKSILLACYYELDEFDPLFSHIESFKVFVKRNKSIAEDRKKSYLELIKYTKELSSSKHDQKTLKKLKSAIEQSQAMSKKWLLEKVDELL
ncbi:MAG: hypothetical protein IPM34_09075 [Saprospiraceae bacterium]|nr:hypothetical protein [Saprospiraceae bacterium]